MGNYDTINTMTNASIAQRKLFFALCKEAGLESEDAKTRVKKKLELESFKDISSKQISELIEKLQTKTKEKHDHDFKLEAKSDKYRFFSCTCGTVIVEPR